MLSVAGVSAATAVQPHTNTVHASTTSVAARSLGVDVASYQNADLSPQAVREFSNDCISINVIS